MPKQITSMTRLTGQLERMFKSLNESFYDGQLDMPIITVTPTARAYAHYTPWNAWESKGEHKREINISSAYLNRPLEYICASMLHEMAHMYSDTILNVQDTSNRGVYHNKIFRREAEAHGLICTRTEEYGYSDTSSVLSDELLDWVLLHDEFREIELCRATPGLVSIGVGSRSAEGGAIPTGSTRTSSTRKLICTCCGNSVRATKVVNILCGDCLVKMVET